MTKLRIFAIAIGVITLAGLTACVSQRPYVKPVIEEVPYEQGAPVIKNARFTGLTDLITRSNQPIKQLSVIHVHGMCPHDEAWARGRFEQLRDAVDGTGQSFGPSTPRSNFGQVKSYTGRIALDPSPQWTQGAVIDATYLIWSGHTEALKNRLQYDDMIDDDGEFPYKRARLNKTLKASLMNQCFSDAVIYSGKAGSAIRSEMFEAVCSAFGGQRPSDVEGQACQFTPASDDAYVVPNLALISESLGSKVLFDAIRAIRQAQDNGVESLREFQSVIAGTQSVFLVSNQIPLLDLAEKDIYAMSDEDSSLSRGLDIILAAKRAAPDMNEGLPRDMEIVGFSDPNDLLSYRLVPRALHLSKDSPIRVINVIASNTPTWFGFVANPDTAHTGYWDNDRVVDLLVNGNEGAGAE